VKLGSVSGGVIGGLMEVPGRNPVTRDNYDDDDDDNNNNKVIIIKMHCITYVCVEVSLIFHHVTIRIIHFIRTILISEEVIMNTFMNILIHRFF
jgi:hypothetical protein